jgi:hypothetical protein
MTIKKFFAGHGFCEGIITGQPISVDSTLYENTVAIGYKIKYSDDTEELEEGEIRPLLVVDGNALRADAIASVKPAFAYLEQRIIGVHPCPAHLSWRSCHALFKAVRLFHPGRAVALAVTPNDIDIIAQVLPAIHHHGLVASMKTSLPTYLQLGATFSAGDGSVAEMTAAVLQFWRQHGSTVGPAWCHAARLAFALTPSSAASERVFSLLACLFPQTRERSLADQVELTLMLRYNKRNQH